MKLSQKDIGERIVQLRKFKNLSQEDLAKRIKISRSSLAQIELGNRSVDILELQQFSIILGFSLDDFVSDDFSLDEVAEEAKKKKVPNEIRISVPLLQVEKFKNILLYI